MPVFITTIKGVDNVRLGKRNLKKMEIKKRIEYWMKKTKFKVITTWESMRKQRME